MASAADEADSQILERVRMMKRTQTIAHLEIALLELTYAKADAFHRILSSDGGMHTDQWEKLISKLDAVSKAVQVAISILDTPSVAMLSREAA